MSIRLLTLIGMMCCIVSLGVAQSLDDLDLEFESISVDRQKESSLKRVWDDHFFAHFITYYSSGTERTREVFDGRFGFDTQWSIHQLTVETRYVNSDTKTKMILLDQNNFNLRPSQSENVSSKVNKFILRDAYVESQWTDSFSTTLGQQRIVWGQFDIFSPMDFLLPFEFGATGISLNKSDNRLPMLVASTRWYPVDSIEIETFFLPEFKTNAQAEKYLNEGTSHRRFENGAYSETPRSETIFRPSGSDEYQYAVRALWYGDWATIGVTYFRGWESLVPIKMVSGATTTEANGETNYHANTVQYGAYKKHVLGLEMAKPFGRLVWKTELNFQDSIRELSYPSGTFEGNPVVSRYYQWAQNQNDGRFMSIKNS